MKNEDIRWRVRDLAYNARVTVGDLIREARVSWATLHRWHHGLAKPRPLTMQRLEQAAERLRGRT